MFSYFFAVAIAFSLVFLSSSFFVSLFVLVLLSNVICLPLSALFFLGSDFILDSGAVEWKFNCDKSQTQYMNSLGGVKSREKNIKTEVW